MKKAFNGQHIVHIASLKSYVTSQINLMGPKFLTPQKFVATNQNGHDQGTDPLIKYP